MLKKHLLPKDPDLLSCFQFKAVPHWLSRTSIVLKCRELIGIILAFVTHKLNVLLASFWLRGFPNHSLIARAISNNNLESLANLSN